MSAEPWIMAGDFNEAMWQSEHFSKRKRSEKQMFDFREVLSHRDIHDLGFKGTPWTFDNKQKGGRMLKSGWIGLLLPHHGWIPTPIIV